MEQKPPVAVTLSGGAGSFCGLGIPMTSFDQGLRQSPFTERTFILYSAKFLRGLSLIELMLCAGYADNL